MTSAASLEPPAHGVLAVLQALVAQLMALLRGPGARREIERRLVSYEIQLVLALFGGGLSGDLEFSAAPAGIQRGWRRGLARELRDLRILRRRVQAVRTARGVGYRRSPFRIIVLRFERRIARRRTRVLGCARLAFVAPVREKLAGAPP